MKKMRKTLAFVLVFAVVVSLFATFSIVGQAYTTPGNVDEATVKSRLDSLYNILNLKYFTVNQAACGYWLSDHGCDNCYNQNVFNQQWFKNLFGNLDLAQVPTHYTQSSYITRNCWSCAGFATFAEWYLFRTRQTDSVTTYKVGSGSFNYAYVSANAKIGDVARLDNAHSVVIYSITSSGIYVLDCNTRPSGDGSNCRVRKSFWSYGSYSTITLSRANNYSSSPVLAAAPQLTVSPTTTTDDKEVTLTWNACTGATSYSIMYSYNGSNNQYYKTGITSTSYKMTFSKPGTYVVYVDSVNAAGANPSNKVTVTVGKSLKSIAVHSLPDKTEYTLNENFDSTGLVLKLTFSDDSVSYLVSGYSVSGFDSSSGGAKTVTVSYEGKTTTFDVKVIEDLGTLVSVSIGNLPKKTTVIVGEKLNTSGLEIHARYSKGYTRTLTSGFTVSGFDSSKAGKTMVTVNYNGKTASFEMTVIAQEDWSAWALVEDIPAGIKDSGLYKFEYADGYRKREKQTTTNGYASLSGWTLDSKVKTGTSYGSWSLNRPSTADNQGATEHTVVSVETKNVYDSFAWVNSAHDYYWHSVTHSRYTNEIHIYSSARNFTVDSDNSYVCHSPISSSNPGGFGQVFIITDNGSALSSFTTGASNGKTYFWANGTRDIYRTVTEKYIYTHSKWGSWSEYLMTPISSSEKVDVEKGTKVFVRYKALPVSVTAPDAPTVAAKTENSITLTPHSGYEYRMEDTDWSSNNVFTGLMPGASYKFYQRIAATPGTNASPESDVLKATTLKRNVNAPKKPTSTEVTKMSVTLAAISGYEYKCGNGNWQTSNVFTGLMPGTEYKFYQRMAETSTSYASNPSEFLIVMTLKDETPETDAKIRVSSASARADGTVEITISVENNPGVVSMSLNVAYDDSVLTLTDVKDGGILGSTMHRVQYTQPYILNWVNDTATSNFTADGTLVTLTFKVNANATEGSYPISVSYNYDNYDIYDIDVKPVKFTLVSGGVEVRNTILGDVNGDGVVTAQDRVLLARYLAGGWNITEDDIDLTAADVNLDGKVNGADRAILARYIAKWDVSLYTSLPCSVDGKPI